MLSSLLPVVFDCPTCGTENGVPLETIPGEGRVLRCRECGDAFRVFPPEEEPSVAEIGERSEATAIESVPPVDDSEVSFHPGPRAPSVLRDHGSGDSTTAERPIPVQAAERGLDPELDDTGLLGEDSGGEAEAAPVLPDPPAPSASAEVVIPIGESGPHPTPSASFSRAVEEPSVVLRRGPDVQGVARAFGRVPLAAKAALFVFPVALLAVLLLRPGEKSAAEPPISIPAAEPAPTASVAAAPKPPPPPPPPPPAPPPAPPKPAEEHRFIGAEGLRLRARPRAERAGGVAIEIGARVRVYDRAEGFALVRATEDGAVGWVADEVLADERPLAALAKDLAFTGCRPRKRTGEEGCIDSAEAQLVACLDKCKGDAVDGAQVSRCEMACKLAFTDCRDDCKKNKKKRRRRR